MNNIEELKNGDFLIRKDATVKDIEELLKRKKGASELNVYTKEFREYLIDKLIDIYQNDGICLVHSEKFQENFDNNMYFFSSLLDADSYLLNIEQATINENINNIKNNITIILSDNTEYILILNDNHVHYSYPELFNKFFTALYYKRER